MLRGYRPDCIVLVDDGHGEDDLFNLIVEIKGFRGEDLLASKNGRLSSKWRYPVSEGEQPNEGELILYRTPTGSVKVAVLYETETFWLSQKQIAELFAVDIRTISEHLQNIYASGELAQPATLRKIRRVQREGRGRKATRRRGVCGLSGYPGSRIRKRL
jgi:hypothetical protein